MKNYEMDILYHMASFGDEKAFAELFEAYQKNADGMIEAALSSYKNAFLTSADFYEFTSSTFSQIIRNYDPTKVRFKTYMKYVLDRRIPNEISRRINNLKDRPLSLDCSVNDMSLYETIEDKSIIPLPDDVSLRRVKYEISSPKFKGSREERLRRTMNLMLMAGYSKEEIRRILKLKRSDIRILNSLNENDKGFQNLKLELK